MTRVTKDGIADAVDPFCGFIEADTIEAAARLFENHPHFIVFPGGRRVIEQKQIRLRTRPITVKPASENAHSRFKATKASSSATKTKGLLCRAHSYLCG